MRNGNYTIITENLNSYISGLGLAAVGAVGAGAAVAVAIGEGTEIQEIQEIQRMCKSAGDVLSSLLFSISQVYLSHYHLDLYLQTNRETLYFAYIVKGPNPSTAPA